MTTASLSITKDSTTRRIYWRTLAKTLLGLLALMLVACAGDDGDSGVSPLPDKTGIEAADLATGRPVTVYLADQDQDGVNELYWVGKRSVKLNPPFPKGRNIVQYAITPDGTGVVYRADQDTNGVYELYRVDFSRPGLSTKLNGRLVAGGNVINFKISSDSTTVVYLADQITDRVEELFRVLFSAPGVSRRVNEGLGSDRRLLQYDLTPDGTAVVYAADETTFNQPDLYLVAVARPGESTRLNRPLAAGRQGVRTFRITPDGQAVVYIADERCRSCGELFWVALRIPGISARVNDFITSRGLLGWFEITPDSRSVLYLGGGGVGRHLYRAPLLPYAIPGGEIELAGPFEGARDEIVHLLPDSRSAVYLSDHMTDNVFELYHVNFATPGVSTKLNPALPASRSVFEFQITPDGQAVVYTADQTADGVVEVFTVPLATPGASTQLNDLLLPGGDVRMFQVTPDGAFVLYVADKNPDERFEVFRVPLATPGIATKLNGPLVTDGDVHSFAVQ